MMYPYHVPGRNPAGHTPLFLMWPKGDIIIVARHTGLRGQGR